MNSKLTQTIPKSSVNVVSPIRFPNKPSMSKFVRIAGIAATVQWHSNVKALAAREDKILEGEGPQEMIDSLRDRHCQ